MTPWTAFGFGFGFASAIFLFVLATVIAARHYGWDDDLDKRPKNGKRP